MSAPLLSYSPTPYSERIRLTREMCAFLERAGLAPERYELIDGEMVSKTGRNPPHARAIVRLLAYLFSLFGQDWVRTQSTMEVRGDDRSTNRPEPDALVLREPIETVPEPADVLLAVEVCATTTQKDYEEKYRLYARAGMPEYWILDVNRRVLMVYRRPNADTGEWAEAAEFTETETVAPLCAPNSTIIVAGLLP